ncbi:Fc.00g010000.m01.CDS01 [Cosmosporella sp. VM-42]
MSLTQKDFILTITNYLPILLTAFVYIPSGDDISPWLESILKQLLSSFAQDFSTQPFRVDSDKLRSEVIALTVAGQISNDIPDEAKFLAQCRNESSLPTYSAQDDIAEIVCEFGYLALFSPVWPLISIGFLVNNWIELRSDFAKICIEHQRPVPIRADGIGPWINSLEALTWVGSISTAAIVHLFSGSSFGHDSWATLPITVFISEHVLMVIKVLARFVLQQTESEGVREDRNQRYANRVWQLAEIEAAENARPVVSVPGTEGSTSVPAEAYNAFWTKQLRNNVSESHDIGRIKRVKLEQG